MKIRTVLAFTVALFAVAFVVPSRPIPAQNIPPGNPLLTINTVSLNFTTAQIDPNEGNQVVRAFVPTGSKSVNCLATLNETNIFPVPNALFCGEREPAAFGGVPGMLISVFLPQPVNPDFVLSVTLYQQGAKSYGAPVLCTSADGC